MKVKYAYLDRRNTYELEAPAKIKDSWGTPWEVASFHVEDFTGKSVRIRYYGTNKVALFRALKRLTYGEDGKLYCKVADKVFSIGTWEIKEVR